MKQAMTEPDPDVSCVIELPEVAERARAGARWLADRIGDLGAETHRRADIEATMAGQ
jgi:hypothetical protein